MTHKTADDNSRSRLHHKREETMKRKQFVAIMMSMIVAAACLPMNSVGALAAENTGEGITDIAAVNETEEVEQEEPEISAGEMTAEDRSEAEEVGDKEDDETYTADTAEPDMQEPDIRAPDTADTAGTVKQYKQGFDKRAPDMSERAAAKMQDGADRS